MSLDLIIVEALFTYVIIMALIFGVGALLNGRGDK